MRSATDNMLKANSPLPVLVGITVVAVAVWVLGQKLLEYMAQLVSNFNVIH